MQLVLTALRHTEPNVTERKVKVDIRIDNKRLISCRMVHSAYSLPFWMSPSGGEAAVLHNVWQKWQNFYVLIEETHTSSASVCLWCIFAKFMLCHREQTVASWLFYQKKEEISIWCALFRGEGTLKWSIHVIFLIFFSQWPFKKVTHANFSEDVA